MSHQISAGSKCGGRNRRVKGFSQIPEKYLQPKIQVCPIKCKCVQCIAFILTFGVAINDVNKTITHIQALPNVYKIQLISLIFKYHLQNKTQVYKVINEIILK